MQYNQKTETDNAKKYLRNARKAILGRGGEISPTAGLKDLPEAIYKIPADASLAFQSDDTVAYRKIVPATAEEYAQIAKIGGMTYKCPVTNYLKITGTVSDQLSDALIINSDGSITILSGDPDSSIKGSVELDFDFEAPSGEYYFFATGDDISEGVTVSIISEWFDEDTNGWDGMLLELGSSIHVEETHRFSKLIVDFGEGDGGYGYGTPLTFKLWIAKTTEDIFEGLRDTKVTELVSEGANLWDANWEKGELDVNTGNEANVSTAIRSGFIKVEPNVFYTVRRSIAGNYIKVRYYDKNKNFVASGSASVHLITRGSNNQSNPMSATNFSYSFKVLLSNIAYMRIVDTTNDLSTVYSMYLGEYAEEDIPIYKPFRKDAIDTFTVSEELRAFLEDKGYGRGVEGYPNYIDFERKVFVPNTYRKVFDGTENWRKDTTATTQGPNYGRFRLDLAEFFPSNADVTKITPAVCNGYNAISADDSYYSVIGISAHNKKIFVVDPAYETVDEWKAHLAELYASGNPLIVEYALANPIEVDISAYLKDGITFLKVEGGGTITAVNEREQAVPSTINYIAKVGG